MQESRAFKIGYYLLERGKSTASELSEQFEVSIRTIYRDINTIGSAGIPIYTKLKFDKSMTFLVYDEFMEQVMEDEQRNLYVETNLPDNETIYSYLLSFADCVEVIEPCSIRERIKQKIHAMQYEWKKHKKELYSAKNFPILVNISAQKFIMIRQPDFITQN